ncbi:unnamed protein product [Phyllotreta striolata]|uniref:TRAF3-interacting protein 1 n=1 Tax=Phyllotreta striolata TaxID=444603 RepID=A0A9N9TJS1_PHYSR|nr:unnamed protein product [Phyllotreta striolata]
MSDEVSQETIKKTQKTLGKYVKKPQLTDKLLKKPPFRFLHDVIRTVIKETGFLRGLYTEEELVSDNVKDKDAKIAFLNKLIEATKTLSKSNLSVRATKIVAGLEPTNTNLLLQAVAKSIDSKADSTGYVSQLKSSPKDKQKKTNIPTKIAKKPTKNDDKSSTKTLETPKSNPDTPKPKAKPTKKDTDNNQYTKGRRARETTPKENIIETPKAEELVKNEPIPRRDSFTIESKDKEPIENLTKPTTDDEPAKEPEIQHPETIRTPPEPAPKPPAPRPTSARPKSALRTSARPAPIEITQQAEEPVRPARPRSSLRPPSVRPSSARPGAPRLLRADPALQSLEQLAAGAGAVRVIVDDADAEGDEEEVVVAVEAAPFEPEAPPDAGGLDNKGHLVEQILEQCDEAGARRRTEIDWDDDVTVRSKDGPSKDASQLAELVRSVTKTALPLGKLVSYVHEDVESMQLELQLWIESKRRLYGEIARRRRASSEADGPLLAQLEALDGDAERLRRDITRIGGSILRNDARIRELLCK